VKGFEFYFSYIVPLTSKAFSCSETVHRHSVSRISKSPVKLPELVAPFVCVAGAWKNWARGEEALSRLSRVPLARPILSCEH